MTTLAIKALLAITPAGILLSMLLSGLLNPIGFMLACLGAAVTGILLLVMGQYKAQEDMDRQLGACVRDEFALRRRVSILEDKMQRLYDSEIL